MEMEERYALWDVFLARWPLDTLPAMALAEYADAGNPDAFVNWLEGRTEALGSIWGGSSFKFGVYSRAKGSKASDAKHLRYSDDYAWLSRLGDSAEQAFQHVLRNIVAAATAAREGRIDDVEAADLAPVFKWKIAFLYQDRDHPSIVPLFAPNYARAALDTKEKRMAQLHELAISQRDGRDILSFGDELCTVANKRAVTELSLDQAIEAVAMDGRFRPLNGTTPKVAGFMNEAGRQLAVTADGKRTTLFFQQFDLPPHDTSGTPLDVSRYSPAQARTSSVAGAAPLLRLGHAVLRVVVPTLDVLVRLLDAYDADDAPSPPDLLAAPQTMQPLNQILYGPPGTGKTYATIEAALAILDPMLLARLAAPDSGSRSERAERRRQLKARFDTLAAEGRVRFVTFHQSFSYEDFIEGLSASPTPDRQLEYVVKDGVFKLFCDAARTLASRQQEPAIGEHPRVWKISIDGTGKSPTRQYCLAHGEARIGWDETGDLAGETPPNEYHLKLGSNDTNTLEAFSKGIVQGDILVCIGSATTISALGVVTGPYRFDTTPHAGVREDYKHVLPVDWLHRDLDLSVLPLNNDKQFTQKTVYELDRFSWGDLVAHLEKSRPGAAAPVQAPGPREPHVLIIDEINRGNVSRIFGELITLIEPSKREGREEKLEAVLPYSRRPFTVPDNVYLIGTMNTADRSLASMDVALRRRFSFREMPPQPQLLRGVTVEGIDIGDLLAALNQRITALLDRDHALGHAYFMTLAQEDEPSLQSLARIFRDSVLPLLQECFFEDWQRIHWVLNDHRKSRSHQIVALDEAADLVQLFGSEVRLNRNIQQWRINEAALETREAFAGILSA